MVRKGTHTRSQMSDFISGKFSQLSSPLSFQVATTVDCDRTIPEKLAKMLILPTLNLSECKVQLYFRFS